MMEEVKPMPENLIHGEKSMLENLIHGESNVDHIIPVQELAPVQAEVKQAPAPAHTHATEEQQMTNIFMFSVFMSVFGNSFVFGYNIGVVNTPASLIQAFYNKTYYEREGGNWQDVLDYEKDKMDETSASDSNETTESSKKSKVNFDIILEKWQLELMWSTTVALFVFFGMVGAFSSAKIADHFGRKRGMVLITFIMFIAALFGGLPKVCKAPELLMLSRVFVGLHSGINISLCPLYLAEISPVNIRGAIGTCHQLAITIGILIAQIMSLPDLLGTEDMWPVLFGLNGLPSMVCLILLPLCPESPRFLLIKQGKEEAAREALVAFRGTENVQEEIEEMKIEASKSAGVASFSLQQLISTPELRLPIIIACSIQVAQQWSGINAVMSYSAFIFAQANVDEDSIPYVIVGTGTINVMATVVAVPLIEKLGRRPLLLWPMVEMAMSFIVMTVFLNLMSNSDQKDDASSYAIVCIIATHTYVIGFAVGLGPIPFIVVGEIFRQEPRAAAMSLSLAINWICNFCLMLIFPFMKDALKAYTYLVFAAVLAAAVTFIFFFVPETKNKSFDEIANSIAFGRAEGQKKSLTVANETEPMANKL